MISLIVPPPSLDDQEDYQGVFPVVGERKVLFWISFATPQALPGTFSVSHHRPTSHASNFFWAVLTFYVIPEAVILRVHHIRQPRQALR